MTASLLFRAPLILGQANRPIVTRDPMVRAGTKFLFDLTRPSAWPSGIIPAGTLSGTTTISDLSGNNVSMTFPSALGWTVGTDGSLSNTQGASNGLIGTLGQFNMSASPFEFVVTYWVKIPATGYDAAAVDSFVFGASNNVVNAQFDVRFNGLTIYPVTANTSPGYSSISGGQPHQVGLHYIPGALMEYYLDGILVAAITNGVPSSLTSASAVYIYIMGAANLTIYRMSLVNITASIAAEEAAGYNSNAILTAAQHINQEWNFCNNLLPAAPKTAFV